MINPKYTKALDELTLFDDELMTLVFDQNIPAAEYLLRIILKDNDLCVKQVTSQRQLNASTVGRRHVRLDILAEDLSGRLMNIEVQRRNDGALPRRARLHSAMVDSRILPQSADYEDMPDSYVIFITEQDYFKAGLPRYSINRNIGETSMPFPDGSHIIYVNGSYQGTDPICTLMHDFHCAEVSQIRSPELAKAVRHFKEQEGSTTMGRLLDELIEEETAKGRAKGLEEGRVKGLEEGRVKGLEEGRVKGLEEGRAEGRAEGTELTNKLVLLLFQDNRTEDLIKSASDPEFQQQLLKEYHLV